MNKARITYRFDGQGRTELGRRQEPNAAAKQMLQHDPQRSPQHDLRPALKQDPKIISLSQEEFRVVEASADEISAQEQNKAPILNEFTSDFGAYRSPFEEETERVERIIRQSQRVNGESGDVEEPGRKEQEAVPVGGALHEVDAYEPGHQEQYREPFANGYEGYRSDSGGGVHDYSDPLIGNARYVRSSSSPPWTRIVLSVTAAVATGVLFGFLVLSMFTDRGLPFEPFGNGKQQASAVPEGSASKGANPAAGSPNGAASASAGQTDKAAASSLAGANLLPVNLPARSYSFLQNGIFSTAAAAQSAEADLAKKGLASASEQGDKTTVYAGFALQKDDASQLAGKLKNDKVDVYVKAVEVPAAPKLKWIGKASAGELSTYFQQGDKLVQMIGGLTVLHLGETNPEAIEQATLEAIKTTYQTWQSGSVAVKAEAPAETAAVLEKMSTALNTAVQSMDQYGKNPSDASLWQAQSALMQYVLAEKGLVTQLAAQ